MKNVIAIHLFLILYALKLSAQQAVPPSNYSISLAKRFERFKNEYLYDLATNKEAFRDFYLDSLKHNFIEGEAFYILKSFLLNGLENQEVRAEASRELSRLSTKFDFKENRFLNGLYLQVKGLAFLKIPNSDSSIKVLKEAQNLYDGEPLSLELAHINLQLIESYHWGNYNEEALALAKNTIETLESYGVESSKARAIEHAGIVLGIMGRYAESNDYLFKALELYKKHEMIESQADTLDAIAFNKSDLGDYKQAIKYRLEAIKLFDKPGVSALSKSQIYSNIGNSYNRLGNMDKVEFYISKAIEINEQNKLYNLLILMKSNLVVILAKQKKFQKALKVLKEIESIDEKYWDKSSYYFYYKVASATHFSLGEFEKAEINFKQSEKYAEQTGDNSYLRETYERGIRLYRAMKKTDDALSYQKKVLEIFLKAEKEKNSKLLYKQENKLLEKENQLKDQEAKRLQLFLLTLLILLIFLVVLMISSYRKSQIIRDSERKMNLILDNIDEGICMISKGFSIGDKYSKKLDDILPDHTEFNLSDFFDKLMLRSDMSEEQKSLVRQSLDLSIGADELQWEANKSLLPREVTIRDARTKILSTNWQAIYDDKEQITQILLSLKDITTSKNLELQLNQHKLKTENMTLKVMELINANKSDVIATILRLKDHLDSINSGAIDEEKLLVFKRNLHTIKGLARQHQINQLSNCIHETEGLVDQVVSVNGKFNLDPVLMQLIIMTEDYLDVIEKVFSGTNNIKAKFSLCRSIENLILENQSRLKENGIALAGFNVSDQVLEWPENIATALEDILIHAVNNTIDHGFIFPYQRGENVNRFYLSIRAKQVDHRYEIQLYDNGAGLDEAFIRKRGQERGLSLDEGEDFSAFLFKDGFSSQESATLTSGRGVGLSAIKNIAFSMKGDATISNRPDRSGTCLTVSLVNKDYVEVAS